VLQAARTNTNVGVGGLMMDGFWVMYGAADLTFLKPGFQRVALC
jgi:hypothetical protein